MSCFWNQFLETFTKKNQVPDFNISDIFLQNQTPQQMKNKSSSPIPL